MLKKSAFSPPQKFPVYAQWLIFCLVILFLFASEILHVYFLMPYLGSQIGDTVSYAYWLEKYLFWIRLLAIFVLFFALISAFRNGVLWKKIFVSILALGYGIVFFIFNFRLQADHIFHQPINKSFTIATKTEMERSKLVIGVVIDGKAKAYPIQLIGYHHQVMDSIGNTPIVVTYCTVCRSGRVYSPLINGKLESFRLVGMDHFNAVFEDETTKSWWQQATGVAIAGPLKGTILKEFPSSQMTLDAWMRLNPASMVMDPDTVFMDNYFKLEDYDKGTMRSDLVRRDTASWQPKSWVVGVRNNVFSKAYDWNDLLRRKIIEDSVNEMPIVLMMEHDSSSFHVYDRRLDDNVLNFQMTNNSDMLVDTNTGSSWNMDGICTDGKLKGKRLVVVQAYNEFWHSWKTFHKEAKIYVVNYPR